ncbi:hypothetical protein H0H87_006982 [Tephrocybe sp. NHM501043]|nr:hypothetical protein H0H87_006982 [Tephrocybe sp. NHM501043]
MERIQILLAHTQAALPAHNGAIHECEEERPDPEPPLVVLRHNLVAVREPVLVPVGDRRGVVHGEDVNRFDFEAGTWGGGDVTGVRAGGDVLVQEQTPDEVLELPRGVDTRELEDEQAIVVEEVHPERNCR